jgi:hypothetical protein
MQPKSRDNILVGLATRLWAGWSAFETEGGGELGIFLFATASRPALGPTHPHPNTTEDSFPGVRSPGREADHSLPSSSDVKNAGSYTFIQQYVFTAWCLVNYRDDFQPEGLKPCIQKPIFTAFLL